MRTSHLFVDLTNGYEYTAPRHDLEGQVRSNLEQSGGIEIVRDLSIRNVEYGSAPVATVIAVVFNDRATSADLRGVVNGMVGESGGRAKPVDLGGVSALYMPGTPKAFAYVGDDFFIAVFGEDRGRLQKVTRALVSAVQ